MVEQIAQERIVIKQFSKELGDDMRKSLHSANSSSRQLAAGQDRRSKQVKKSRVNDHELIKLGHYGSSNFNAEKTNAHTARNPQN